MGTQNSSEMAKTNQKTLALCPLKGENSRPLALDP
jgi:hypothetical protein